MVVANGHVYGRAWDFGYCKYPAVELIADTYEELQTKIKNSVLDLLDSGMGFETVLGAHYTDVVEIIHEDEWTKTRPLKPIKVGKLSGKVS